MEEIISLAQWHELEEDKKELLRKWAVRHDVGLEIIPSKTSEACDYAALLTKEQIGLLLQELSNKGKIDAQTKDIDTMWQVVKELL